MNKILATMVAINQKAIASFSDKKGNEMHNSLSEKDERMIISELVSAIQNNRDTGYKEFMFHLRMEKKYNIRCRLLLNRHVYGSLVKKAMQEVEDN